MVDRAKLDKSGGARRESHRESVHAVAQSRRFRAVVEYVTQMAAAAPAMHFRAHHAPRTVLARCDGVIERRPEARPARVAVELRARRKEVEAASRAPEQAAA